MSDPIRKCAQCRLADWGEEPEVGPADAEFYVAGRVPSPHSDRLIPYRGYICRNHYDAFLEDGAEFTRKEPA